MQFEGDYNHGDSLVLVFKASPSVMTSKGPLWHTLNGTFCGWGGVGGKRSVMRVEVTFDASPVEIEVAREDVLFIGCRRQVAAVSAARMPNGQIIGASH